MFKREEMYESASYTLQFLRWRPDKIFKVKLTTARRKVKLRSHQDICPQVCINTCI